MSRPVLTLEVREAIRRSPERTRVLAARLGVSPTTILRIRSQPERPRTPREAFELVAAGAWRASCMTDEEWATWIARNPSLVTDTEFAPRPCVDCPLWFAEEMRAEGTCNGEPGQAAIA